MDNMGEKINNTLPMWGVLAVSIENIWKYRNQTDINKEEEGLLNIGLNTNLILNFAAFIEGALKDILIEYLKKTENDSVKRKDEYLKDLLKQKGYQESKSLFKVITGINWEKELISQNTHKAIEKIFQLRNVIVHGNSFQVVYDENSKGDIQGKYKQIYAYFINEVKLISVDDEEQYKAEYLFQNCIIDFFLKELVIFIEKVLLNKKILPSEKGLKYPKDFINEYLKIYIKPLIK